MSNIRRRRTACGTCVRRKVKCGKWTFASNLIKLPSSCCPSPDNFPESNLLTVSLDETHPHCQRCQKGNFTCEGFDPEFVFVEEDPRRKHKTSKETSQSRASSRNKSATMARSGLEPKKTSAKAPPLSQSASSIQQTELAASSTLTEASSTASSPLQRNEIPYLSLSTAAYLSRYFLASLSRVQQGTAHAFFARVHHEPSSRQPSSRRFGQTLQLLNEIVNKQSDEKRLEALPDVSAMLLKNLVLFGTDSNAWNKHVDILSRLVIHHSPRSFVQPRAREFLESIRGVIIKKCLLEKTSCFLAETEWREVPWSLGSQRKDFSLQLEDIYCQIPGLVAGVERLDTEVSDRERPREAEAVGEEIRQVLINLFQWRCNWQIQNPWAAHSVPLSQSKITPSWTPFVSVIHFDQPRNAWDITLYNAAFINLCALAQAAIGQQFSIPEIVSAARKITPCWPTSSSANLLALPTEDLTPEKAASEVCTLVDYHFEEPHRSEAVFTLVYALRVAETTLEHNDRIVRWIGEVMSKIVLEDASGFSFATGYFSTAVGSSGHSPSSGASNTD